MTNFTELKNKTGIYRIFNRETGEAYYGSSAKCLRHRLLTHVRDLNRRRHHSWKLQESFDAFGESAFEFRVVEFLPPEECRWTEQQYICVFEPALNIALSTMEGCQLGLKRSRETLERLSKSKRRIPDAAVEAMLRDYQAGATVVELQLRYPEVGKLASSILTRANSYLDIKERIGFVYEHRRKAQNRDTALWRWVLRAHQAGVPGQMIAMKAGIRCSSVFCLVNDPSKRPELKAELGFVYTRHPRHRPKDWRPCPEAQRLLDEGPTSFSEVS